MKERDFISWPNNPIPYDEYNMNNETKLSKIDFKKICTFQITHSGESAAGIIAFTDTIKIYVESGNPGGETGDFRRFMLQALSEWYDGAKVE
jgi:hypothetical protein